MLEAYVRPIYQSYLVNPIAKFAGRLSPAFLTYLSCLIGLLVAPALIFNHSILATLFLLLSGFFDTLDGTVARMRSKTSDVGTVLDVISDRIVEFAVIAGLYGVDPIHRGWLVLTLLGSFYICITCFLVSGIFIPNQSDRGFHYSPGLVERTEAFIFFILMIWLPSHFNFLAITLTLLVILTSYLHFKQFLRFKSG